MDNRNQYRASLFNFSGTMLIVLLIIAPGLLAQNFTRITNGAVVSDGGHSIGCSWADYDNDGDLDLYVTNGIVNGQEANFLYKNQGDGTFVRDTTSALVSDRQFSESSSWGDYDNDGWIDVFVGNSHWGGTSFLDFLFQNQSNGTFQKITDGTIVNTAIDSRSIAWADYDNDGYIDMFIANEAGLNYLYKNDNGTGFTRITGGTITSGIRASAGCAWADYDHDGDLDLFVANMSNQNNQLYRNEGDGTFTSITSGSIVSDGGNSIGCSWGDYNNDGYPDLFVANFNNQNNFLYENNGDGTFSKISSGAIVSDGGNSFGSAWGDYDNDGDLDLYVTNLSNQNNFLYENNGDGSFNKITAGPLVSSAGNSEGCAWADYDHDGDLDIYVVNFDGQNNQLFNNDGNNNHWLNVRCVGTTSNKSAIGARVSVKTSAGWQMRTISGQTGYQSQNSLRAAFGLSNAQTVDTLRVEWPSGQVDTFSGVGVDQRITVTENGGITGLGLNDTQPMNFQLKQNYPNPFNPTTTIEYALAQTSWVTLDVYDLLGQKVRSLVNEGQNAGQQAAIWDGRNSKGQAVASGMYIYRLTAVPTAAATFTGFGKMVLLR